MRSNKYFYYSLLNSLVGIEITAFFVFFLCGCSFEEGNETFPLDSSTTEQKLKDGGSYDTFIIDEQHFDAQPQDSGLTSDSGYIDSGDTNYAYCISVEKTVLVLYGGTIDESHEFYQNTLGVLKDHRLIYETKAIDSEIAYIEKGIGKYGVVVITDYDAYEKLEQEKKKELDTFNQACNVGVFFLYVRENRTLFEEQIEVSPGFDLSDQRLNKASDIPSIAKNGGVIPGILPGKGRFFKTPSSSRYSPIALAMNANEIGANIISDKGFYNGVRRIYNGHDFYGFWYHELLFLDGLQWLSPVNLNILRFRWINVDIDDVFQPNWDDDETKRTVKIQRDDVTAMIATQRYLSSMMEGDFRFSLGFNSGFYEIQVGSSPYDDLAGDHALVANRAEFRWFDHLPQHDYAYGPSEEELATLMQVSKDWAATHGVSDYITHYSVTPKHSGISEKYYPLFQAWHDVWDIRYSSTTHVTSGFEYLGIRVAPRQGLNGIGSSVVGMSQSKKDSIDQLTAGGTYYHQIIDNPVTIFMTHQGNYARDRIMLYTIERLIEFIHAWTNFRLIAVSPDEAVSTYFDLFTPAN